MVLTEKNIPADDLFVLKELSLPVFKQCLVNAMRSARLTGAKFEPLDETFTWPV